MKEEGLMLEFLKKSWNGSEKLWKVFWLYYFLVNIVLNIALKMLPGFFGSLPNLLAIPIMVIVWAYIVWILVSLWRCAFNTEWKVMGYVVRVIVVIFAVLTVLSLGGGAMGSFMM